MKKVLIIEDDPIVAHIYRSRLEKEGFTVDVSADGQAGYYRLYDMKPDALLLDLMLPKLNGIELLKKIRAVREFEKMPVIVFTNAYVANMIHESFTAGATGVYNKSSVTPRQIIDVLNTTLNPDPEAAKLAATPASNNASPAISTKEDAAFQTELVKSFLNTAPTTVSDMRRLLQETSKAPEAARTVQIEGLFRKVRSFSTAAGMAGVPALAKIGAATEALVKEMIEKPKSVTPSTLRTTAHAIDFFGELSKPTLPNDIAENPISVLIVDDELLSRRAIVYALEKASIKATAVEDGEAALAQTKGNKFDLIFLDVNMPGMDGFQLCDRLRNEGPNKSTPVIFVTSTADFQVRAQSTLRGASDVIAKPFMFIELTVKALTFALRHRIDLQKSYVATPATTSTSAVRTPGAVNPQPEKELLL